MVHLPVCFYHVAYAFQSECALWSYLNVKKLLARSRGDIWRLSDCNRTRQSLNLQEILFFIQIWGSLIDGCSGQFWRFYFLLLRTEQPWWLYHFQSLFWVFFQMLFNQIKPTTGSYSLYIKEQYLKVIKINISKFFFSILI